MHDVRSKTLIAAGELARLLDDKTPVILLDVLDEAGAAPDDRPKLPGALSVSLATDFSGKPTPAAGRRPLPEIAELQIKARAWGIRSDSLVVVYDNASGAQAARAWWTLRWAGLTDVRLLDGGYGAWIAAGRPCIKSSRHARCRRGRRRSDGGSYADDRSRRGCGAGEAIQIARCAATRGLCGRSRQAGHRPYSRSHSCARRRQYCRWKIPSK